MKSFIAFLMFVLPVSTRTLLDPVASLMNVQDLDVENRRHFRFQNEIHAKSIICAKHLRCGEECLWNGKKGPARVLPGGGCCPSEGWTGTVSCNGHGACVRDTQNDVIKPLESSFIEIQGKKAPKVKYNIMLTATEMQKSLGSNYASDMAQSVVPFDKKKNCDIKLKEESPNAKGKCKKGETFGCGCVTKTCLASGRDEMTMWVDKGCGGYFQSMTSKNEFACFDSSTTMTGKLTKEQLELLETTKTECKAASGFTCEIGQGPKDKKFSDMLEKFSFTRLTAQGPMLAKHTVKIQSECFNHCTKSEECVSFDYARVSKKKKPQPNCRLYRKNTPQRVGDKYEGGRKWLYCVVAPEYRHIAARCGTNKKTCVAAKCMCSPGWAGFGCEIDLNAQTPCSPLDPACGDEPAPPPIPCFGQPEDFPLDHPCRSTFAYNVPYPPRSPPKSEDGLDESLQAQGNEKVPIWKPKEEPGGEGGEEEE